MPSFTVDSDEAWRALRAKHIGSSEIAALFDMHQYGLTRWQLHMIKAGKLPEAFESSVMTQGKFFEPAIAAYAAEKFGLQLRKVRRYQTADDCEGYGASVDYEAFGDGALIPTELKWSLWGSAWDWEGDTLTQAPDSYVLQVQHQLGCSNAPHGQLIAFTGGDLRRMIVPRNETIIEAIKSAIAEFWRNVREGREPPVDFNMDGDAIGRIAATMNLKPLTLPAEAAPLFATYAAAAAEAKAAETRADAAKAELLKMLVDAGPGVEADKVTALCGVHKLMITKVAANAGKVVTQEMVGTYVGARREYQRVTIGTTVAK